MLFSFIRYTQPAWQFNLTPLVEGPFASCYCDAAVAEAWQDLRYQTESARLADAGYHLWNKGALLLSTKAAIAKQKELEPPTKYDEYLFIRKYWGGAWAAFALMLRLFTFKNPLTEINSYVKTRKVKKIHASKEPMKDETYEHFVSPLVEAKPLVAVIIPTLNRYPYLADVLHDLEQQDYPNFEVIIVDQSEPFNPTFYEAFRLRIKLVHQKEKLLWTARNHAVSITQASFLLFFDDDSRVAANWITAHLKCMDYYNADISAGVSLAATGQKIPENYRYFRWADQFDSGNAMVKSKVMEKIGLFDEQFNGQRMGDGEFGYRAYMNGLRSISNPQASRIHLKVKDGGLREMGSWDGFRPKQWFAPKPVPSVIYLFRKYFPEPLANNALLIGILLSNVPYRYKRSSRALAISLLLSVIKAPLLYFRYKKSEKQAVKMLANAKLKVHAL